MALVLGLCKRSELPEMSGACRRIFILLYNVVYGEGYLVMLEGASEIFSFRSWTSALLLFLFGNKASSTPTADQTHWSQLLRAAAAPMAAVSKRELFQQSSLKAGGILVALPDLARKR